MPRSAQLGSVTLVGRGLGAYVALLLAGARPQRRARRHPVRRPGPRGRRTAPGDAASVRATGREARAAARSVRARRAGARRAPARLRDQLRAPGLQLSDLERPISVCAIERPDWLARGRRGARRGGDDTRRGAFALRRHIAALGASLRRPGVRRMGGTQHREVRHGISAAPLPRCALLERSLHSPSPSSRSRRRPRAPPSPPHRIRTPAPTTSSAPRSTPRAATRGASRATSCSPARTGTMPRPRNSRRTSRHTAAPCART